MQLRLSFTLVFFMITRTLCGPHQLPSSGDANQNEPTTETTIADTIQSVKLDVNKTFETRNETLDERLQFTPSVPSKYPLEHENRTKPESTEPIEQTKAPSRSLTAAELYAIESVGDRVSNWTAESGVYPHELGSDMILPSLPGEFMSGYIPREESSKYRLDNVLEISRDVILLVGKRIHTSERIMYAEQDHDEIRAHEQSGMSAGENIISVDKQYTQSPEYRVHIGMPRDIRSSESYMPSYPRLVLPGAYQENHENRHQGVYFDGKNENENVATWTSRRRPFFTNNWMNLGYTL